MSLRVDRRLSGKKKTRWTFAALERRIMLAGDADLGGESSISGDEITVMTAPAVVGPTTDLAHRESRDVVFVSLDAPDAERIAAGLDQRYEYVLLDATRSGLEQIGDHLALRSNLNSVHIIAHGDAGEIVLGNERVTAESFDQYRTELRGWARALSPDADILLYGCDVASDVTGQNFVRRLAAMTGADVAASTDMTGNQRLGGDWELEYSAGMIEAPVAVDARMQRSYAGLLPITIPAAGTTGEEQMLLQIDGTDDGSVFARQAVSAQALLPDLMPWVSESQGFVYGWTIQGNDLRLTSAMANIGTGRMELRGGETNGDFQDVYQRIYEPDGSYTDVLAGVFTYHPEHGHIHFDEFAEFRLRELLPGGGVGAVVATGDKVSFCLLDVERYDTSGPASPYFLSCEQVQGISVGWADVYDQGLPGQSIEITNVADGDYWLEVVVDPGNHLMESDETNNVARIQITLERPAGEDPIPPDTFEPNNSFATASILAPPEDHVYDSLSIHSVFNDDYYRVTASATGTLSFDLAFEHSRGDLDMEVFDASQTLLGRSESEANSEHFSVNAVAGEYFYVRVFEYTGSTSPNYTLSIDQSDGIDPGGDLFENNDSFAAASYLVAADQTYGSLTIDARNDDDYYALAPTNSGTMTVSLSFLHSQGDIDLRVFDASQTQLALSDSTGDSEQVSLQVSAGQTYFVRAYGYNGAINPNYSMTIDLPESPTGPPPDPFEDNDSFATANSLVAVDQTYSSLTIDAAGDDDYYSLVPEATGTMTVSLAFLHSEGDIDLRVFNATQTQLALSDSAGSGEQVSLQVTAGQTYYVRVYGYNAAINPNYSMTIDVPGLPFVPQPDPFEDNDSFVTANNLAAVDQTHAGLTIDAVGDDDYYALVPAASGTMTVNLAFVHSDGDIDLRVFDASRNQLAISDSTGNSELVSVQVTAGQTYYVWAYGYNAAISPNYSMTIDLPDPIELIAGLAVPLA